MTLPELMVTITILAVVGGALTAAVVASQRSLGSANATMRDVAGARNAIERVGSLLRSATSEDGLLDTAIETPLISAAPDDVSFYTRTGVSAEENPVLIRLFVDADADLVEERILPTPASGGTPTWTSAPITRVLVADLVNVEPFTFWSHVQTSSSNTSERCGRILDTSGGAVSTTDLLIVDSVSYAVQVRDSSSGYDNRPVELRGWARLANVDGIGYSGGYGEADCLDLIEGGYDYVP